MDDQVVRDRFQTCSFINCRTVENDKLAYCSRAVIAEKVQGFVAKERDYLYIGGAGFKERFREYYLNREFMEACRYCKGVKGELITPAIQIEEENGRL